MATTVEPFSSPTSVHAILSVVDFDWSAQSDILLGLCALHAGDVTPELPTNGGGDQVSGGL